MASGPKNSPILYTTRDCSNARCAMWSSAVAKDKTSSWSPCLNFYRCSTKTGRTQHCCNRLLGVDDDRLQARITIFHPGDHPGIKDHISQFGTRVGNDRRQ